jgi:hypothetical protein
MTEIYDRPCLLNELQFSLYSCICYFDVFRHPVTLQEICAFNALETSPEKALPELQRLQETGMITFKNGHYCLGNAEEKIKKRLQSEQRFEQHVPRIGWFARLIARFPYVECLAISGSCSKGLMSRDGDVDYFVITRPGRLWLCRSILIGFKKLFLFNSHKYFCLNYFIDSTALEIPDKNIFVASEIRTLLPVSNPALFEKFLRANRWTSDFLPNKNGYNSLFLMKKHPVNNIRRGIEWMFRKKMGDALDNLCFRLTLSRWKRKFPGFNPEDFDLNFRSRKSVSKHHPYGFQIRALKELRRRLEDIKAAG